MANDLLLPYLKLLLGNQALKNFQKFVGKGEVTLAVISYSDKWWNRNYVWNLKTNKIIQEEGGSQFYSLEKLNTVC